MSTRPVRNMYDDQQYLNRRHKVITRQDLDSWLFRIGKSNAIVDPDNRYNNYLRTVTRAEIESGVYALYYDGNNNDEGLSISGYSIGDGKSQYASNQNVIVQDVQFVLSDEPQTDDHVFEVYVKDANDKRNFGYVNNVLNDSITFQVVCCHTGTITITKIDDASQFVTPQAVEYKGQNDQDLYVYEFDVKVTQTTESNIVIPNWFKVSHSSCGESNILVNIGHTSTDIYTNTKYKYSIDNGNIVDTYDSVVSANYSFKIPSSDINDNSSIKFTTDTTNVRVSNRATPPGGVGEYEKELKNYTFSPPFTFNINVGRRTFTPTSEVTINKIPEDSTILFTNSATPGYTTTYSFSNDQYFSTTGNVVLSGISNTHGQLYAKISSESESGSVTAKVSKVGEQTQTPNPISKNTNAGDWSEYYGFVDNPNMTLNIDKISNVTFKYNNAQFTDANVVAYKLNSGNMTLFIDLMDPYTGGIDGYTRYAFNIGDVVTGKVDEQETTFNVIRKTYYAYDQHCIYITIPNYDNNSNYEINIPQIQGQNSAYKTLKLNETWCPLTYQFGDGIKCSDLETITTRLWKDVQLYENVGEIRLCEIKMRDGVVPKCDDKPYISFARVNSNDEYAHYLVYVSGTNNKSDFINNLNYESPMIINITGNADFSAKEYSWVGDDFPPILIDNTPEEE